MRSQPLLFNVFITLSSPLIHSSIFLFVCVCVCACVCAATPSPLRTSKTHTPSLKLPHTLRHEVQPERCPEESTHTSTPAYASWLQHSSYKYTYFYSFFVHELQTDTSRYRSSGLCWSGQCETPDWHTSSCPRRPSKQPQTSALRQP